MSVPFRGFAIVALLGLLSQQIHAQCGSVNIFGAKAPATMSANDSRAVELGMKFKASVNRDIAGVRFYKGAGNAGPHVGKLYDSTGRLLASVKFTSETTSGWQSARFASPVRIIANTVYTVSYLAPVGHYSADENAFASNIKSADGTLIGIGSAYRYNASGGYPKSSYKKMNYYVDVLAQDTTACPTPTPTPVPTPTPTPIPTPTPTPGSGGFPDASTTGVPAGISLKPSGEIHVSVAGTVIDAMDVNGSIIISADNVTIKRSRIRSSNYWAIRLMGSVKGVVIEDCDIDSLGGGGQGIYVGDGINTIIRRNDIQGAADGVDATGSTGALIEGNYIHNFWSTQPDPHFDGIQADGGISNLVIRGNTINVQVDQTSAVMIDNYWTGSNDILVENNRLLGGGYTVYCDGNFNKGALTNVRIINNRVGQGYWGTYSIRNCSATVSGNVNDSTGLPAN